MNATPLLSVESFQKLTAGSGLKVMLRPRSSISGRSHRVEELADFELEALAVAGQRLCRQENLRGGRTGLAGAALHVGDVGGDLLGAVSRLLDVAGNFLRRRTLLFHRGGNG